LMKKVSIYVPKGHYSMVNIEGAHHMLQWVNGYFQQMGQEPLFDIQLVGIENIATQGNGLFSITPQKHIKDVKHTDLIIIPATHGNLEETLTNNQALLPWLVHHYKQGAELVSFCLGAFHLAAAGL